MVPQLCWPTPFTVWKPCNSPSPRPAGAELPCCTSFPTCFFFVSLPIFQPLFTYLISPSTLYPIDPARSGRPHLWFGTERGKITLRQKRPPSTTRYWVGTAAFRRCRGDCAICGWRWERMGCFARCGGRPGRCPWTLRFFEKNRVKLFIGTLRPAGITIDLSLTYGDSYFCFPLFPVQ